MHKLFNKIKTYISPFLNWRILIIYLPIWFLMSGWTYLFIYLGTRYNISWMLASGTLWATILWLPFTPEKLITIPLTLLIYCRWVGHSDEKLERLIVEAKQDFNYWRSWFKKSKRLISSWFKKSKRLISKWFRRNYPRIVKTLLMILLFILTSGLIITLMW